MKSVSARVGLSVLLLTTAIVLAQADTRSPKQPASMVPPAPFVTTTTPKTTPPHNTTTAHTTPSPHNTTTAHTTPSPHNTTTAHTTPSPHNTTTAHTTPSPHNTTTAHTTPPPHNTTTAHTTTPPPPPHNTTTANVTTVPPTPHNTTTAKTTTIITTTHTPRPEPTPKTNVTVGNYTVNKGSQLCIMVQAAIQVQVNNTKMAGNYIVPGYAKSAGTCENNTASLTINLDQGYITMNFLKNDTSKMVFVSGVAVNLTYAFKSGVSSNLVRKNESMQLFSMATGHSYSCKSESVFLGDGAYLMFSKNRLQAFSFTNNQFGSSDLCKADQPDYRVAVGVGVVLIILIIIVIVAYLISRRRRTDGYQTL